MAWTLKGQNEYGGLALDYLNSLPTISTGHFDNLKIDENGFRIWLSRMTIADGMPYDNQVTIEKLIKGEWITIETYPAVELGKEGKSVKKVDE